MRAILISLVALTMLNASAQSEQISWMQAYAACTGAASLHGYHLPRLCACVATAVEASKPTTRAAAYVIGRAAAGVCLSKTGMN